MTLSRQAAGRGPLSQTLSSPPLWSPHPLSHAEMLSDGRGCLSLLSGQHEDPAGTAVQPEHHAVGNDAEIGAGMVGHTPGLSAQQCVGPGASLRHPIPTMCTIRLSPSLI